MIIYNTMSSIEKPFCCIPCNYFCSRKSNLIKHHSTKKHIYMFINVEPTNNAIDTIGKIFNTGL